MTDTLITIILATLTFLIPLTIYLFIRFIMLYKDYNLKIRDLRMFKSTNVTLCWLDNDGPGIKYSQEKRFSGRFNTSGNHFYISEQEVDKDKLLKNRLYLNVETFNFFKSDGLILDKYYLIAEFDSFEEMLTRSQEVWNIIKEKYIDGILD